MYVYSSPLREEEGEFKVSVKVKNNAHEDESLEELTNKIAENLGVERFQEEREGEYRASLSEVDITIQQGKITYRAPSLQDLQSLYTRENPLGQEILNEVDNFYLSN